MNDITAPAHRLATLMQEDSVPMSDSWGRLFDALQAGDTENERMARDLISRNCEIEGLRKRVEELEEIATDYGMKFQRAQDDLKKMALMDPRTVKLRDINEYLAEVHDKTLALTFRRLAEAVRDGDVAAMRAAGIQVIEGDA